jgi:signal transduction histidine kinase
LIVDDEIRHLFLIAAYRDNEVGPSHPIIAMRDLARNLGVPTSEIVVRSLARSDLSELVASVLHCDDDSIQSLAELVYDKTGGNPFFAIQFVSALIAERLIAFDPRQARWTCDIEKIQTKGYADNVVDFVLGKLGSLPRVVLEPLKRSSCLGSIIDVPALAMVYGDTEDALHAALSTAVRAGLIIRIDDNTYKFPHDRIQEAAYSLIPPNERSAAHLRIGRFLVSSIPLENVEGRIFDIVDQLNRAMALIISPEERERLARLNQLAGKRAMASSAHASALTYLDAAAALLLEDCWQKQYSLAFSLGLQRAECSLLTGDLARSEEQLSILCSRSAHIVDHAAVACLRILLYQTLGQSDQAVDVALALLSSVGIVWSSHPTRAEVENEIGQIWQQLAGRPIATMANLPSMNAPLWQAIMDVLVWSISPAMYTDENLLSLVAGRIVNLTLQHGTSAASCIGYVYVGAMLGSQFADYDRGFRFGKLGVDLAQRPEFNRFAARVNLGFADMVSPWARHVRSGVQLLRNAFTGAYERGDFTCAAYCWPNLVTALLANAEPLAEVQHQAELGLEFVRKIRFDLVARILAGQLRLIRALRGVSGELGSDHQFKFDEDGEELSRNPRLAFANCWILVRRLQAFSFAGNYVAAIRAAAEAESLLWTSRSFFELADYHFYAALARSASCRSGTIVDRSAHVDALVSHLCQLKKWEEHGPENFEGRAVLVSAELARVQERDSDAMGLYERAIQLAHRGGFTQNEALASELAGRFCLGRDLETAGLAYMRNARACYVLWGADGKVSQIDRLFPRLIPPEREGSAASLDVAAVVRASQTVSSEIDLPQLIRGLMTIALQNAGADRGVLLFAREGRYWIAAEASANDNEIEVDLGQVPVTTAIVPQSLLNYVARTHESLLLDDAAGSHSFSEDEYICQKGSRSILCVPLIKQAKLIGLLYLENSQTSHAFTPARVLVLKLLASQAAISIENARLYADLVTENSEREKIEKALAEAQRISHTGSWHWHVKTGAIDASQECLRIFDIDPAVGAFSYSIYMAKVHPEDRRFVEQSLDAAAQAASMFRYENRIVTVDGSVKHVQSIGHPNMTSQGDIEFVGPIIDITDRKRAEEALRRSQSELARVARLSTMGELAGSIIHEVNQPLTALITGAEACVRWLGREDPDLGEARRVIANVVKEGQRAADVIKGLRTLARKSSLELSNVNINDAIREVLVLLRGDFERGGVTLDVDLTSHDIAIVGDRVQLQQVLINLIRNGIEAMSTGGNRTSTLKISSRSLESGEALVRVEDSGVGISSGIADRIFDPLFTTKDNGMGMGLSISRSIVEAHRGRIWTTPNQPFGTVFQFTVPMAAV